MPIFSRPPGKQQGSALIVSLSILLVLTILGVSTMRTTSLEEKMAGNARDAQAAFAAAEAAMREAENLVENLPDLSTFNVGGSAGYFTAKTGTNPAAWTLEPNWANAQSFAAYDAANKLAAKPRFMVQIIDSLVKPNPDASSAYGEPSADQLTYFQITSRGFGISPNSRAILQVYYSTPQKL